MTADLRAVLEDVAERIALARSRLGVQDFDLVLDLVSSAYIRLGAALGRARWLYDLERNGP